MHPEIYWEPVTRSEIQCGLVGLGRIGRGHHLKAIYDDAELRVAAVCDLREAQLKEAQDTYDCRVYSDYKDLIADPDLDMIVVASQTIDHCWMAMNALDAGKHVVVEKPAAIKGTDVRRMVDKALTKQRLLTMHHNRRFDPDARFVKEVVESGKLGDVFRISRKHCSFQRRDDWQTLQKYGGGIIGNWGIHLVDQVMQFIDDPDVVCAVIRQVINPGDAEDDVKAFLRDSSSRVADIEVSNANATEENDWTVLGTNGSLWITGGKAKMKFFNSTELWDIEPQDERHAETGSKTQQDKTIPWQQEECDPVPTVAAPDFYENLVRALRGIEPLLVSPESAVRSYEVLDRIWQSADGNIVT